MIDEIAFNRVPNLISKDFSPDIIGLDISSLQLSFVQWLATQQGIINWIAPSDPAATVRTAYNSGVPGLVDSALFPGPELLINGDFNSDVSGWTPTGAVFEWVAGTGKLTVNVGGVRQDIVTQTPGLIAGVRYILSARLFAPSTNTVNNAATISMTDGGSVGDGLSAQVNSEDVWETVSFEFIPTGSHLVVHLLSLDRDVAWGAIGDVAFFDDISIRIANPLNSDMTGSTPAQPFSGVLPYANSYDGNNDYDELLSDALDTAFPRAAGTFHMFFDYASNLSGRLGLARFGGSAVTDILQIDQSGTGEDIRAIYGGGSLVTAEYSAVHDLDTPHHIACTWKFPGNLTLYFDGIQRDQIAITSAMGATWEMARIGFIPTVYHDGLISDCILDTKEETPIEVAEYYTRWGG